MISKKYLPHPNHVFCDLTIFVLTFYLCSMSFVFFSFPVLFGNHNILDTMYVHVHDMTMF